MNIVKALAHFEYKLKNNWKPTAKDLEAYNSIIDFVELQKTKSLSENESLAKLFIHQYMLLMGSEMYSSNRALQVIDEILKISVYEWCLKLKQHSIYFRLNNVNRRYPNYLEAIKGMNVTKLQEVNAQILAENEKELTEILKSEISEKQIIDFVKTSILKIILENEK
jgi:hypothetical protein